MKPTKYGQGLILPKIGNSNLMGWGLLEKPEWTSVNKSTYLNPRSAKPTEFSTTFHLLETPLSDPKKKAEYVKTWTKSADPRSEKQRFTTEYKREF